MPTFRNLDPGTQESWRPDEMEVLLKQVGHGASGKRVSVASRHCLEAPPCSASSSVRVRRLSCLGLCSGSSSAALPKESAHRLKNESAKCCQICNVSANVWHVLANVWHVLANVWPAFGTFWPTFGTFWPTFGTFWSTFGTFWPTFCATFGTFWPTFGTFWPTFLANVWHVLANVWLARFAQRLAHFSQRAAHFGQSCFPGNDQKRSLGTKTNHFLEKIPKCFRKNFKMFSENEFFFGKKK